MNVIFRADASSQIGAGHLMRCLALAQALKEDGSTVHFACTEIPPTLATRLRSEGVLLSQFDAHAGSTDDASWMVDFAQDQRADWVVLDGYNFGSVYQQAIKWAGFRLLCLDDYGHADHYYADLVLNQNISADASLYRTHEPHTHLLLGTQFVLLRREFWPWRGWKRIDRGAAARNALITMGGGDSEDVMFEVIRSLGRLNVPGLEARIVVGSANPHIDKLTSAVESSPCSMQLLTDVADIPEQMAWADIAIAAGGGTCWELSFMGVSSALFILAENQRTNVEELGNKGVALNLSRYGQRWPAQFSEVMQHLLTSEEARSVMAERGQEIVDGYGIERVMMHLQGNKIWLRSVQEKDNRLIWEWANAPDVRMASFSSEAIPWEHHRQWFHSKLKDQNCLFFLAFNEKEHAVGQVRYEIDGVEARVSVCVDRSLRGKGYGSVIIILSARQLYRMRPVKLIHAYIKQGNETSIKAFLKAGFCNEGTIIVQGQPATHMILRKAATA